MPSTASEVGHLVGRSDGLGAQDDTVGAQRYQHEEGLMLVNFGSTRGCWLIFRQISLRRCLVGAAIALKNATRTGPERGPRGWGLGKPGEVGLAA